MNTTAGSFALLGSIVPEDAGVVKRLRKAGAIILGINVIASVHHLNHSPTTTNNNQVKQTYQSLPIFAATKLPDGVAEAANARILTSKEAILAEVLLEVVYHPPLASPQYLSGPKQMGVLLVHLAIITWLG